MAAFCQSKNLLTMLAQRDTCPQLLAKMRTYPQSCKQKSLLTHTFCNLKVVDIASYLAVIH